MFLKERDHSRQSNLWKQMLGFWRPRVHEGNYFTHNSKSLGWEGEGEATVGRDQGGGYILLGSQAWELAQELGILDKEVIEFHLCFKNIIVESVWKEN